MSVLTANELAARWRISQATLARRRRDGTIPQPFLAGGSLRWRLVDIEKFEQQQTTATCGQA